MHTGVARGCFAVFILMYTSSTVLGAITYIGQGEHIGGGFRIFVVYCSKTKTKFARKARQRVLAATVKLSPSPSLFYSPLSHTSLCASTQTFSPPTILIMPTQFVYTIVAPTTCSRFSGGLHHRQAKLAAGSSLAAAELEEKPSKRAAPWMQRRT